MRRMAGAVGALAALWAGAAWAEEGVALLAKRAIPQEVLAFQHPLSTFGQEFWVERTGTPNPEWKGVAVRAGLQAQILDVPLARRRGQNGQGA